jgi:hypothetical protein
VDKTYKQKAEMKNESVVINSRDERSTDITRGLPAKQKA